MVHDIAADDPERLYKVLRDLGIWALMWMNGCSLIIRYVELDNADSFSRIA
jgi:hypothetical protein